MRRSSAAGRLPIAPVGRVSPALRALLEQVAPDIEPVDDALVGQPARYLEQVESTVRRARAHLERELAEAATAALGADEWLVLDGRLSRSPAVARHPRALGVIKSHGAQFLEGRGLERALTLRPVIARPSLPCAAGIRAPRCTRGTSGSGRGKGTICCTDCCGSKRARIARR